MTLTRTYLLLIALMMSTLLAAQRERPDFADGFQLTGMGQFVMPQNAFAEAYPGNPTGLAASMAFPVGKHKLLYFGGEYAWTSMARERTQISLDKQPEGILVGDMTVSSEIRSYHANMRFSPLKGSVRLYFDVLFGMRVFSSDTEILVEELDGTTVETREELSNESTNSLGISGGLMMALGRNLFLDARLQSFQVGEVRFVDPDSIAITTQGEVEYTLSDATADMLVPQVGLSVVF